MGPSSLHLATDGFLNCSLSKATVGYLWCPSGTGADPGVNTLALKLKGEDDEILSVIISATLSIFN